MKDITRQISVIVSILVTLIINGLADALPLNGQNTGQISDRFNVYFVPAGYVFSIWGLIYIGLIAFAIYQALPSQRANPRLQATLRPGSMNTGGSFFCTQTRAGKKGHGLKPQVRRPESAWNR